MASGIVWLIQRLEVRASTWSAIREDEDASEALGVDTFRYKMLAYAVSAGLTALGGTFYAYYQFYLQPNTVLNINHSVDIMIRPIVGGSGTILGPDPGLVPAGAAGRVLADLFRRRRGRVDRRDLWRCS